ncbi:hypothetical protein ACFVUS_30450 [Nocardia sp. NPDC058058]|uniref:hypothetical protein n=1 Tax=Nocardia sp. NPDC058058 TaxID=3346317 RepID=UPI0036DF5073
MNGVLVGASLHSTVVAALRAAAGRASGPVDTRALLVELMQADSVGRWGRIQLFVGDPDAVGRKPVSEAVGAGAFDWNGVPLTDGCAVGMEVAGRLAYRYGLWPLPVGMMVLGLVADERSAAARALRGDGLDRVELLDAIQADVLGTRLDGIDSVLPMVLGEAGQMVRAPRGRRGSVTPARQESVTRARQKPITAARQVPLTPPRQGSFSPTARPSSKPWSRQRRWTVAGAVAVCMALSYIVDMELAKRDEKPSLVANSAEVQSIWEMRGGCDSPRIYYPDMDAYTGSGPHRVTTFLTTDTGRIQPVILEDAKAPPQWGPPELTRPDMHRIQLIACLGKASEGVLIKDCWFDGGKTLPMYQGIYQANLYEAKTGRKVASERVVGKREERCPVLVMTLGKLYSEPGLSELQQTLGQYVDH